MTRYTALIDATALVPAALADTLLRIAERGLFRPLWSERILQEARAAILLIHPDIDQARVDHRFDDMRGAFEDAMVTGWEHLEDALTLPDPNDRHVLAAAIRGGAQAIVTSNLRDFPEMELADFDIEPVEPDQFLLDQLDLNPAIVSQVVVEQAADARTPPLSPADLASILARAGAPQFADEVIRHIRA